MPYKALKASSVYNNSISCTWPLPLLIRKLLMNRAISPPGRRCHSCFPGKFKQRDSKKLPVASSTDVLPVASSWELCVSKEKVGVVLLQNTVLWCNSACKISKRAQMLEAHPASVVFLQGFPELET